MILSDGTLRQMLRTRQIGIEPLDLSLLQPASLDVRLGSQFLTYYASKDAIDPFSDSSKEMVRFNINPEDPLVLQPQAFCLGTTLERLTLPNYIVARIEGKSSLGRLGLFVHATAGFVDPGWRNGELTLELYNASPRPIRLWAGMKIAQLSFMRLDHPAQRPYGRANNKYQGAVRADCLALPSEPETLMQLVTGKDIFAEEIGRAQLLLFTANSTLTKDKRLVMGAGSARQVRDGWPGIDAHLGARLQHRGLVNDRFGLMLADIPFVRNGTVIGAFQTKIDWRQPSTLELIAYSTDCLQQGLTAWQQHPRAELRIALPFPGIKNGKLPRDQVLPIISKLPDNVYVYEQ